jgi:hypothetical protein
MFRRDTEFGTTLKEIGKPSRFFVYETEDQRKKYFY